MNVIPVIAYNYKEFTAFCMDKLEEPAPEHFIKVKLSPGKMRIGEDLYLYVHSIRNIRGGRFKQHVEYGRYYLRKDWSELRDTLKIIEALQ